MNKPSCKTVRLVEAASGVTWTGNVTPSQTLAELLASVDKTDVASSHLVFGPRGRLDLREVIYPQITDGSELTLQRPMTLG